MGKVEERVMSHFDVSIGTGIALATYFEPYWKVYEGENGPVNPVKENINKHDGFIVNVDTLIRNIIEAWDTDRVIKDEPVKDIIRALKYEINVIDSLIFSHNDKNKKKIKLIIYIPDYKDVFKHLKLHNGKKLTKSERVRDMVFYVRNTFSKDKDWLENNKDNFHILLNKGRLKGLDVSKPVLFTHYAHDLLNYKYFAKLYNLNSYTGEVLRPMYFNKKYKPVGKKDMSRYPFCEKLLYAFGDKNRLIESLSTKTKKEVIEYLDKAKVTPATNCTRINSVIKDTDLLKAYREYYV